MWEDDGVLYWILNEAQKNIHGHLLLDRLAESSIEIEVTRQTNKHCDNREAAAAVKTAH